MTNKKFHEFTERFSQVLCICNCMKKFILVCLIFSQIGWRVNIEAINRPPAVATCFPSFNVLLKIVFISVKTNMKNIVNLWYIFSHLPQKRQKGKPEVKFYITLFFAENKKRNIIDHFTIKHLPATPAGCYYNIVGNLLTSTNVWYLTNFVDRISYDNSKFLYYFSKPRSSI